MTPEEIKEKTDYRSREQALKGLEMLYDMKPGTLVEVFRGGMLCAFYYVRMMALELEDLALVAKLDAETARLEALRPGAERQL